jgi:cytochrome c oxidase subunit 1
MATMAIAIPTGVKIFNWLLTMWGGKIWYTASMKFAIGLVILFTIGGLSGVTHAVAPSDTQQTDTYYIVAHFHYVLFGGMVFGLFSGFYYWWPKVFGKMLNEKLGTWNFWFMVIGMNLTFGPMHSRIARSASPYVCMDRSSCWRRFLQPRILEHGGLNRFIYFGHWRFVLHH